MALFNLLHALLNQTQRVSHRLQIACKRLIANNQTGIFVGSGLPMESLGIVSLDESENVGHQILSIGVVANIEALFESFNLECISSASGTLRIQNIPDAQTVS